MLCTTKLENMKPIIGVLLTLLVVTTIFLDNGEAWRRRRRRRRRCSPINCKWSLGSCSVTCGTGFRSYIRTTASQCGGTCVNPGKVSCTLKACPVACKVSEWSAWSQCSKSCRKIGVKTRSRSITVHPQHDGASCPVLKESKNCTILKLTCKWRLEPCSVTCGIGVQAYTLENNSCPQCVKPVNKICRAAQCPVKCVVSKWSHWSGCRNKHGSWGIQIKTRTIKVYPKYGGKKCPQLMTTKRCKIRCGCRKTNCRWKWNTCRATSRRGFGIQRPYVFKSATCGGSCWLPRARSCRLRAKHHKCIHHFLRRSFGEEDDKSKFIPSEVKSEANGETDRFFKGN